MNDHKKGDRQEIHGRFFGGQTSNLDKLKS